MNINRGDDRREREIVHKKYYIKKGKNTNSIDFVKNRVSFDGDS